jgi:hypothetical protein
LLDQTFLIDEDLHVADMDHLDPSADDALSLF